MHPFPARLSLTRQAGNESGRRIRLSGRALRFFVGRILVPIFVSASFSIAQAAPLAVTVVLSERNEAYLALFTALENKLADDNIRLVAVNAGEPLPQTQLVVTLGAKAGQAATLAADSALLHVLLPKARYDELHQQQVQSAIYVEQTIERQSHLLVAALPQKRRVGILHTSATADQVAAMRRHFKLHGYSVYAREVGGKLTLPDALQEVLANSDVLFALPEPGIYNSSTLRNILFSTYRAGIPLIGFSAGYVNAGALAAIYSTPAQIIEQTAEAVQQYAASKTLPAAQYPRRFEISVNEKVANSLGLALPDIRQINAALMRLEHEQP